MATCPTCGQPMPGIIQLHTDFAAGDTVVHRYSSQIGIVEKIEDGVVIVNFEDGRTGCWRGAYDDDWLRIYPHMLVKQ